MASKLVLINLIVFLVAVTMAKVSLRFPQKKSFAPRSCLDHYKIGSKSNGNYKIYNDKGAAFKVYCDMTSELGSAWTLVESFAFKYNGMPRLQKNPLWVNSPVNEKSPNRYMYRMTLPQMKSIKSQSTHWRITCNFPTSQLDYTDYVRAKFSFFDIMTFSGGSQCKLVEYVNIRGHACAHCTTQWWQVKDTYAPHIDSSSTNCQFNPSYGSAASEDNFGYYGYINTNFRCSSGPWSTTNFWFGGYQ